MKEENKYVLLCGGEVLLNPHSDELPCAEELPDIEVDGEEIFSGGEGYLAMDVEQEFAGRYGLRLVDLRRSYTMLSPADYAAAAKGAELLHWNRSMRHCPRCGAALRRNGPISKVCPRCGAEHFPQLAPAVIVLVRRGEEALLVHARNFRRHFFGLVAGFVETGESLEECVAREVMEETSLQICNIQYFGSQSWPFPSQLMIGFTADYAAGELCFADNELSEGGFFTRDNLPELPTPPSIARLLIDRWRAQDPHSQE